MFFFKGETTFRASLSSSRLPYMCASYLQIVLYGRSLENRMPVVRREQRFGEYDEGILSYHVVVASMHVTCVHVCICACVCACACVRI